VHRRTGSKQSAQAGCHGAGRGVFWISLSAPAPDCLLPATGSELHGSQSRGGSPGACAAALGIRLYHLNQPPLNRHAIRQYRSLLIARSYYYDSQAALPAWKKSIATISGNGRASWDLRFWKRWSPPNGGRLDPTQRLAYPVAAFVELFGNRA
jgi:hypothetical protein